MIDVELFVKKVFVICLIFFCFLNEGVAQNTSQYHIKGKILIESDDYVGINLSIRENTVVSRVAVNNQGRFNCFLDWEKKYNLEFRKHGCITKIIEFSTQIPKQINKQSIRPYSLVVQLVPVFEGVDTVFFKNPVAKIRFDEKIQDFDYDMDYSLAVRYKIEEMKKQAANSPKNRNDDKSLESKTNAKNNSLITDKKESNKITSVTIPDINFNLTDKSNGGVLQGQQLKKKVYPEGKTVEIEELDARTITKVTIKNGYIIREYLKVEHAWGAVFYFVKYSEHGYHCISRDSYELAVN